jgi:hypothetical protein
LRPWLVGLALVTVGATAERVIGLSAPMPTREAPTTVRLEGYRVSALQGEPSRQGRELSHGELRRFQLEPLSGGPPLVLSVLAVRSRTGTELSEGSKERKGLNMVAVEAEVPRFALRERRLLSLPRSKPAGPEPKVDQVALGRGPKDPAGSITRLQTCVTPTGVVALSAFSLVGQSERQEPGGLSALQRRLRRLAGILPVRHECLAVQLEARKPGRRRLLEAWKDVRGMLVRS